MEVKDAMDKLREAFKEDGGYAISWHANIAMACYDSMDPSKMSHEERHQTANIAADRFMKTAFDTIVEYPEPMLED